MTKLKLKLKGVLTLILIVGIPLSLFSQDIHFSQFYASPLTLNPSLTGKMNGGYRLAGIYRSQWKSITNFVPFATPAASFDMPFVVGKKGTNAIGTGILFVNDLTNNKRLNTITVMLSTAYHKALGNNRSHQISLGVQGGIIQTKVNTSDLTFANQYDGNLNFVEGLGGVDLAENSVIYPDFNIGLFYSGKLVQKLTFYTGFSLFHLLEPNQSFTDKESRLPRRYVVHGGLDYAISDRWNLLPGVIYMAQAEASEINFGVNVGYKISLERNKEATVYLGGWYRMNDAAIAMIALEFLNRLRVGFSYDINTSSFNVATNRQGGFEISLIYIGSISRVNKVNLFCPRF